MREALAELAPERRTFIRGDALAHDGAETPGLLVIHDGVAASAGRLPSGGWQMLELHFLGDWVGAFGMSPNIAPSRVTALTPLTASLAPFSKVRTMFCEHPRLAALLFVSGQENRAALLDRLAGLGRGAALPRLARLLVRFYDRLAVAEAPDRRLPLSQVELSQLAGLSRIHTQRAIRSFIADGLIAWRRQMMEILDVDRLAAVAGLDRDDRLTTRSTPDWLPSAG